ncbi:hypothetical protein Syn7803C69_19 [Synechococcus phage ACG-2014b]|uniref:Uncharacterized protein n=1 Tax=Synechococcus phage ACG-2014b TaxID=1493508 RepID=A0A0E3EUG1_9CAUD|nr:hypothetical protein Syn7803C69_19 [Synechococcus phage ACG-2014b]
MNVNELPDGKLQIEWDENDPVNGIITETNHERERIARWKTPN